MKAISFTRPGAQAITDSTCRVINRNYVPELELVGQYVAIHSSVKFSERVYKQSKRLGFLPPDVNWAETGIVGTCKIAGWTDEKETEWFDGPIGWLLEDVRVFRNPIKLSGKPGVWDLPRHVKDMLRQRWATSIPGLVELGKEPAFDKAPMLCLSAQTTGFNRRDKVCGLSMLEVCDSKVIEDVSGVVNPHIAIPEKVTAIHGIDTLLARSERGLAGYRDPINRMLNRAQYICGHDVYFSIKFLAKQLNSSQWNSNAIIVDSKLLSGLSWAKLLDKQTTQYSTFYAKQKARMSYDICKKLTKNTIPKTTTLGTYIDRAKVWRGTKR